MDDITNFLYFIGSVFAPMIAIMIADFLVKADDSDRDFQWVNLLVWLLGFCLYRYLMTVDFVLGNTFPDILITMIVALIARKLLPQER